jgi:rod shape-determining protein MreD
MALIALLLLVLLGAAVPDLMPEAFGIARHPPDVFVIVTIYLATRARGYAAVGWGITLGVALDCLSLDPLGTNAFVLGVVAFLFAEGARHRGRVDGATRAVLVFTGTLAAAWIYALRTLPYPEGGGPPLGAALGGAFPTAWWTVVLAVPLMALLDRVHALDGLLGRSHALSS